MQLFSQRRTLGRKFIGAVKSVENLREGNLVGDILYVNVLRYSREENIATHPHKTRTLLNGLNMKLCFSTFTHKKVYSIDIFMEN